MFKTLQYEKVKKINKEDNKIKNLPGSMRTPEGVGGLSLEWPLGLQ